MTGPIPARWAPYLQSVLRIVVAFLFVAHGTQKFMGFPSAEASAGVPLMSLRGVASVIEMVGGTLLLFGLFTRPIAFVLAGEMAVAYFMVHAPRGFWPLVNRGEPAVFFCFTWLYFAAARGAWTRYADDPADEHRADRHVRVISASARRTRAGRPADSSDGERGLAP